MSAWKHPPRRAEPPISPVYMVIVAIIFTAICAIGAAIAAKGVIAAVTAPSSGCTIEGCPE